MRCRFLSLALVSVLALGACSSNDEMAAEDVTISPPTDTMTAGPLEGEGYGEGYTADSTSQYGAGTQQDLVTNVGDRVFFGYDRYDLSDEARATLNRQADWLKQYQNVSVTVEGHADERGTREYNLALGERRAQSVKNYLVAMGIDPRRVSTISYGKEQPAVLGANTSSWAQNRRGVTRVD